MYLNCLTLQNFQQSISGRSSPTMEYQNILSPNLENAITELPNRYLSSPPPIEPYVIHWVMILKMQCMR